MERKHTLKTKDRKNTGMQKEEEDKEKSLRLSARGFVLVG